MSLEDPSSIVREQCETARIQQVGQLRQVAVLIEHHTWHESSRGAAGLSNFGGAAVPPMFLPVPLLRGVQLGEEAEASLAT
jgi:hypothetical protein